MKLFFQLYFDVDHIKFQIFFSKIYSHFISLCYYFIRGNSHKGNDTLFKVKCKLMVINPGLVRLVRPYGPVSVGRNEAFLLHFSGQSGHLMGLATGSDRQSHLWVRRERTLCR